MRRGSESRVVVSDTTLIGGGSAADARVSPGRRHRELRYRMPRHAAGWRGSCPTRDVCLRALPQASLSVTSTMPVLPGRRLSCASNPDGAGDDPVGEEVSSIAGQCEDVSTHEINLCNRREWQPEARRCCRGSRVCDRERSLEKMSAGRRSHPPENSKSQWCRLHQP